MDLMRNPGRCPLKDFLEQVPYRGNPIYLDCYCTLKKREQAESLVHMHANSLWSAGVAQGALTGGDMKPIRIV